MDIIPENFIEVKQKEGNVAKFLKEFKISHLLSLSNCVKTQGVGAFEIFKYIFSLVFGGTNFYRATVLGKAEHKKDVVMRFLNSCHTNWHKFMLLLSKKAFDFMNPLTNREMVFVIDDTVYNRNRSKKVELLSRVYDHSENKYVKGFRALTLGCTDGFSFIPLLFNILTSSEKKKHLCPISETADKRTNGYKARKKATMGLLGGAIDLLKQAIKAGMTAKYLLVDSWFAFPTFFKTVKVMGIDTIAMLKDMPNVLYIYKHKQLRLSALYKAVKHKKVLSDDGRMYIATVTVAAKVTDNAPIPIKITFIYEKGNKRDWIAIGSTDTSLPKEEIVRIYGKRWSIEVFFKVIKSHLAFAKEFQGRSYDMVVAHTAICYARYIMLSVHSRMENDMRTCNELFFYYFDEVRDLSLADSIKIILEKLFKAIAVSFTADENQLLSFCSFFFATLPHYIKDKVTFSRCES